MTIDFRTSEGEMAIEAKNLVDSRRWITPFLYLESLRAVINITLLEQEGDIESARVWRDAIDFNLAKDREIERPDLTNNNL